MSESKLKTGRRVRRKRGIRKRLRGTADCPRLSVFRSGKNIYAQIIDDDRSVTICEANSLGKDLRDGIGSGGNIAGAKTVGTALAERAVAKEIRAVCFDRNGYRYHGRLKALADAVREGGVAF